MIDNRKISLCITTWNRDSMVLESFSSVVDDERISEIVIVDDCSEMAVFENMKKLCDYPNIKIFRNEKNLDCYANKREAISKATNEWVIIFDSDNILSKSYLDVLFEIENWHDHTLYQPYFAKPHFDFSKYGLFEINKRNVANFMHDSTFSTMLNAMNYFVNRDQYLNVWDKSIDPVTADSIYQNYRWLMYGNNIYVTPGLFYEHRIHNGSHYQNNNHRTGHWMKTTMDRLKQMR